MKQQSQQGRRWLCYLLTPVAFMLLLATALMAQEVTDPHDPANQQSLNNQDMHDREVGLRTRARTTTEGPVAGRDPKLALSEISADYQRIQVLNNELRRAGAAKDTLDYQRIAAASTELKKRAARLKSNLAFPEPADAPKEAGQQPAAPDDAQVKASLGTLDKLIMSFVANPLFQAGLQKVDVQLATKASRDLHSIIELCARLKKNAEKLKH